MTKTSSSRRQLSLSLLSLSRHRLAHLVLQKAAKIWEVWTSRWGELLAMSVHGDARLRWDSSRWDKHVV